MKIEDSLKYYRDLKNSLDTAKEEGKIEGKLEVAKNLLLQGISNEIIVKTTGLSTRFPSFTKKSTNALKITNPTLHSWTYLLPDTVKFRYP